MSGFDYFKKAITTDYANFEGRARRSEYWYFFLFYLIISYGSVFLAGIIDPTLSLVVSGIITLGFFIPNLAVTVRRLHDTGKSGWWILIVLIPLIGFIVYLVFMCTDGEPGSNQYGQNPKEESDDLMDQLV